MRSDKVTGSFIKNLTRKAKVLVKASGLPLNQAQDNVAREAGYENWREMKAIQKRSDEDSKTPPNEKLDNPKRGTFGAKLTTEMLGVPYGEPIKTDICLSRWMNAGRINPLPEGWVDVRTAYGKPEYTKEVELALSSLLSEPHPNPFELFQEYDPDSLRKAFELAHGQLSSYRARGYIHGPREDFDIEYPFVTFSHRLWKIAGANRKEMAYLDLSSLWASHILNIIDFESIKTARWLNKEEKAEKRKELRAAAKASYKAYEIFAKGHDFEVKPPYRFVK